MKKILYSFLMIAAGLLAVSCDQSHIDAVFNPSAVTAQTLGNITGVTLDAEGSPVTASFNAADFKLDVASTYTLYVSASSSMADKKKMASSISVNRDNGTGSISINQKDINSMIFNLGGEADVPFTLYFQLTAAIANDKNAAIESTEQNSNIVSAEFTAYSTVIRDVDLFDHVWVIGASSSVGSWAFEKVTQFLYDYEKTGDTFTGLIDFGTDGPAGGFKLTGAGNWDDPNLNWGSEAQEEEPEATTIQLIASGGSKDIKAYSKRFYAFSLNTGSLVLTKLYSFDNIGIVGEFNGWNAGDANMKMNYNAYYHRFWIDQTFTEATELKFTCDDSWDTNWGGEGGNTAPNGANIAVEPGSYRIYLDLNKNSYEFSASMYGKDEPAGEENSDEPVTWEGWGVVGTINGWGAPDVHMSTVGAFWVAKGVSLAADDQFKFRKDEDWAENIGAAGDVEPFVVEVGAKYEGAAGGKNLSVPADGKYDLYVNPDEMTFYIMAEGEVPGELATWGVVGTINGWGGTADLAMSLEGNMLVRRNVELTTSDQIKIRYQNNWDINRGAPGDVEPFIMGIDAIQAVPNGKNLGVEADGLYDVWYDEGNEVIFVVPAGQSLEYWGVVGNLTDWGSKPDFIMYKEGDFYVHKGIAFTTDHQFKIRFKSDWGENRGAPGDVEPFKVDANSVVDATPNGKNLGVNADANYDVWYDAANEKLYVMAEGVAPEGAAEPEPPTPTAPNSWGIVGEMTSWGETADIAMTKDGDWFVATNVNLESGKQWKLRGDSAWDFNRGAEGETEPFAVTVGEGLHVIQGGKNLSVSETAAYDVYFDSANDKLYVMAAGEKPADFHSFADFIYAIGADTEWSGVYFLRSASNEGSNTGVYKGFGWLSGEFKFKPNADNWDGDWEFDGEGKIADNGGSNCPAPTEAGYYMIEVDLTAMTYKLTLIKTIGIIGPAQAGGWDNDTDMTYNAEKGTWEATVELAADEMKFRANDAWDINWGGSLDALTQGGANIKVEAGTYVIELHALCDGKASATMTKK
ncbi:MAG: SusE domain-containing protein [Bacteroidales bacterium]|nr:SusE domain-containing protein [Bacteroidales bacterium]